MLLKNCLFALLGLSFTFSLQAQSGEKLVKEGHDLFEEDQIDAAIQKYNAALYENSSTIKDKTRCKAHFYRTEAVIALFDKIQYATPSTYFSDACLSFRQMEALNCQDEGLNVDGYLDVFHGRLYAYIQLHLEDLKNGSVDNAEYKKILKVTVSANKLSPYDFIFFDLKGQLEIINGDSAEALHSLTGSCNSFSDAQDQFLYCWAGNTYNRKALLESQFKNQPKKALQTINTGLAAVNKSILLHDSRKKLMKKDIWDEYSRIIEECKGNLNTSRLQLLQNIPDLLDKAIAEFETAIASDPENYSLHIDYAKLLSKVDKEKAKSMFEKAMTIDDKQFDAHYGLGAIYLSQATDLNQQANSVHDKEYQVKLEEEAMDKMKKALPYFLDAHKLKKCDVQLLKSLQLVSKSLKMDAEYANYKKASEECNSH